MNVRVGHPAQQIVERIRDLPAIPGVALRLGELLDSPHTSAEEVSRLLANDPAIASKVLSIANSAYYGVTQRIGTLTHAIVVLGFNTVRNVVFASSLLRSLDATVPEDSYDHLRFWRHSLACGAASKLIAQRLRLPDVEEYFLMGLLHDVGKIVLAGWRREESQRVADLVAGGAAAEEAEFEILGTTHAQVGGALLQRWKLPELHVDAVCNHHVPELARNPEVASVVHVANVCVHAVLLGCSDDFTPPRLSGEAWTITGLSPQDLPDLLEAAVGLVERAESFLGVSGRR